jgi:hypothetical protein
MKHFVEEDPHRTLCQKTYWLFVGYTVKCTRQDYVGVECGHGNHVLGYDGDKYLWKQKLTYDLESNLKKT